jgi:Holliday junction resolvase
MNAKRKGTRNEHRAIKLLESTGYYCTRAAGSLGMWDIVAVGKQGLRLIQCKTNRKPGLVEMEALMMFDAMPPGATKELWIYYDYQRNPEIIVI